MDYSKYNEFLISEVVDEYIGVKIPPMSRYGIEEGAVTSRKKNSSGNMLKL